MRVLPLSPRLARGLFFPLLAVTLATAAAPWVPADDDIVLEHLPAGAQAAGAAPADPLEAALQAQRHIERSRETGDPRFLGYAEGLLQPWWNEALPPRPVLLLRATLLQSRHRFDEALRDLDALLVLDAGDAQARLTRATLLRVRARHDEALADCRELQGRADEFVALLCAWSVRGLHGELPEARAALDALEPASASQPAPVQAWYRAERADVAERLGRTTEALRHYREALAGGGDDPLMRAAAADLLLRLQRPAEALEVSGAAPTADVLRLRTVLAARALGQPRADLEAALADGYAASHRRGDDAHLREEARFVLEVLRDAPRALDLATRNWLEQREPADALLLRQAAQAAGRNDVLRQLEAWRARSGLQDARLSP